MEKQINCKAGELEKIAIRGIYIEHMLSSIVIFLGWIWLFREAVKEAVKINIDYFGFLALTLAFFGVVVLIMFGNWELYKWRICEDEV